MRLLSYILVLLVLFSCNKRERAKAIQPSEINLLKDDKEVEQFIRKSDSLYKKFTLKKIQDLSCMGCDSSLVKLANRLGVDYTFVKADFDNNGYMDLLATGENKTYTIDNYDPDLEVMFSKSFNAFTIMDFGNGNTKVFDLTEDIFRGIVPKVKYEEGKALLVIYSPRYVTRVERYKREESKSELTFKFNDFVEYNRSPKEYDIEKIEYSTLGCFGKCPIFSMLINKNGTSVFTAIEYNYTEPWQKGNLLQGVYKITLKDDTLNEIKSLLNYIDFPSLQEEYNVTWTDDQTAILKVTYNNGKTKTITDYGLQGTYGLRKFHAVFKELRLNQSWH
ncbi:hypothetical protein KJK34_13875 [Flavobacterium sp. D11R37]|uniref:DUF6438 domain-containing protein n=1 Tax=Flavobacterium coralii TaxID=2838017 RepID=UPI001CA6736F|nr:DUF6438 domain-containing protein [Flavobacterium coralii]MBY8963845.1 hypothetical protein [Flavobacterium coralii]